MPKIRINYQHRSRAISLLGVAVCLAVTQIRKFQTQGDVMKRLVLYIPILLLFAASSGQSQLFDASYGLDRYYAFEGNADDSSELEVNGTGEGTYQYVDGKVGQALQLYGNDALGYFTAPPLNYTGSFTVSAWVKPDEIDGNLAHSIIVERAYNQDLYCGPYSATKFDLQIYQGKWRFATANLDPSGTCHFTVLLSEQPITPGQFYHVVGSHDAQTGMNYLYVNGSLIEQAEAFGLLWAQPNSLLRIGTNFPEYGVYQPWHGIIDELRFHSRSLSHSEVIEFYESGINNPPVANAGPDQAVREGDEVILNASASFDDNTATEDLLFDWKLISWPAGSTAVINDKNSQSASFIADAAGTFVVQLIVTDQAGLSSIQDELMISSDNLPPSADAGPDQLVPINQLVLLDGSNSSDPENDTISFSWKFLSKPEGSFASITVPDIAAPHFMPDIEGIYVAQLVVSDQIGPSNPDSVAVTATSTDTYAKLLIQNASDIIASLPLDSVASRGNKIALTHHLIEAIEQINCGNLLIAEDKIQKAVSRTDGCVLRGSPDESGPGRDWIIDCATQAVIYELLNTALDVLVQ